MIPAALLIPQTIEQQTLDVLLRIEAQLQELLDKGLMANIVHKDETSVPVQVPQKPKGRR
jgi:hypothetical protein